MSVQGKAFHPQGFLLGQALARGLPSKKRVTAGMMLAISPDPVGMAATLSLVRSARRARSPARAGQDDDSSADRTQDDSDGDLGGSTDSNRESRRELAREAKEMFDAVTEAAQAVGAAA